MLDEIAIQQTLNTYSDGASRADWEQVLSTFMPDGIWEVPALKARFQEHAAIRQVMAGFVAQMDYFVQINSPAIIQVAGDKATARSGIRECGKYTGRDEALEVLGRYDDELVRTADGWKFARRVFHAAGKHTFALLPAASTMRTG
jgi:ketosteroid isomerase-like protein